MQIGDRYGRLTIVSLDETKAHATVAAEIQFLCFAAAYRQATSGHAAASDKSSATNQVINFAC